MLGCAGRKIQNIVAVKYTYLLINIFTIIGPLLGSFERRVNFKAKWKYAVAANFLVAIPFLIWDAFFTKHGVWGFNPGYYMGVELAGMPIEEWLFFFTVPFACLLIYETVSTLRPTPTVSVVSLHLATGAGALLLLLAIFYHNQIYTVVGFSLAGILLLAHGLILKRKYFSNFWIAFFIHLIPFFIVNGILTCLPVVWYNDAENFGIRMGTIPIEDSIYSLLLLLGNITVYEAFQHRS